MALAIYEGTKKDQLVDEIVDKDILRLLGLENVNDLDYDDYKTLLRERVAAGRMPGNNIPSGDTQRLTEEFKRVKKETGKLKVKNNKIKFNSVVGKATKKSRPTPRSIKRLMGSSVEPEEEVQVQNGGGLQSVMEFLTLKVAPSLSKIEKNLESILGNLVSQQKLQKEISDKERIAGEKGKKKDRENKSESVIGKITKKLGAGAKKLASPIGDIFETIKKFFMGLLGGILTLGLIDLFRDPKKFFTNLVNDNADFFNGILQSIYDTIIKPINSFIDIMNESIFDGFVSNLNKALNFIDFLDVIPEIPSFNIPNIPLIQIEKIQVPEPTKVSGMDGGGKVTTNTGDRISSMGSDTQLVALTPGEVVMSKKAVDAYGADTLLGMNASAGGTNMPRMGMVPGYQGGGMVGGGYGTSEQRKMLDAISFAEGTTKSYGTVYGGQNVPDLAAGKMTIGQVLEMQRTGMHKGKQVYKKDGYGSDATGRYQFMSYVLREEASKQSKSMDTLFTPAMQDELILGRISRFRGVTPELLKQEGMSDKVIDMLAPEFASFPNLFGPDAKGRVGTNSSYYGQGGKSAFAIKKAYGDSTDALIQSSTNQRPTIGVPGGGGGSSVVVAGGGGAQQQTPSSASGGAQSSSPMFSPIDQNNPDLLVIKSIYSIV